MTRYHTTKAHRGDINNAGGFAKYKINRCANRTGLTFKLDKLVSSVRAEDKDGSFGI